MYELISKVHADHKLVRP